MQLFIHGMKLKKSISRSFPNLVNFDQMEIGLSYNSKENKPYLTVKQIRDLIKENLYEKFKPI